MADFLHDPEVEKAIRKADRERKKRIDSNPFNGRAGWWRVVGVRHSATARAESAREAIDKALAAGLVGDWEGAEVNFWTEELPDVF